MTGGGLARLLCTVQCDTTARSAAHRSGGSSAGTWLRDGPVGLATRDYGLYDLR